MITDKKIFSLISQEQKRQEDTLMLIPSENYASKEVRKALGSVLTNKYSEGYANKRYYQGNAVVDDIELLAIERAKKLFGVPHVNVQPYSGSPANSAIEMAILNPGETLMGLKLSGGGHLTHGHPDITFSGRFFKSVQFDVNEDGFIDMNEVAKLVKKEKPKLFMIGTTAYPRLFDWKEWRELADSVGAYFAADVSHIAGLIAGKAIPSPVPYAHVVMTTTHKSLRGPRGAMILVTEEGVKKDADLPGKIDKAVFPGLQGGPHDNTTAGIAIALHEASSPEFSTYAKQVVTNAIVLGKNLMKHGFVLTTNGTENHLMVVDLRTTHIPGNVLSEAMEIAGMVCNKNSVPHDTSPPFYPSGIRLGTPGVTTRGMKENEMEQLGDWIFEVYQAIKQYTLPEKKEERPVFMQKFRQDIQKNRTLLRIQKEVKAVCQKYPMP